MQATKQFTALSGFIHSLSNYIAALQENPTAAYVIVDQQLNIIRYSQPAGKYLSQPTATAANILDAIPCSFKEDLHAALQSTSSMKKSCTTKTRACLDEYGNTYYLRMQTSLLATDQEQQNYLIYLEKIDIAEEKPETSNSSQPTQKNSIQADQSTTGKEEKDDMFRLIFESAPVGMAVLTADNKINLSNKAFGRLLGYTQQELQDQPIESYCSPEDLEKIYAKQIKLQEGSIEDFQMGKGFVSKSGQTIGTILKMSVLPTHYGLSGRFLLQLIDITNRKEFEEHLMRRNEYLEKVNAELDRFVYSASHDLRAPLRSILGLIYIIQQEEGSEPFHVYLDMMISSINRLDRFIRDVIDHSKNLRLDILNEKVDFHLLVSEIFEDMQYISGAEKIKKIIEVDDSREMFSDTSRLKVVLSNLIANAITYHNLYQEEPFVKVTLKFEDMHSIITVKDNGRGIKEEFHQKIFEMFFRASEDTKGSGLGLYIVKETVEKLGGSISLQSEPNQGTTFTVTLPSMNNTSK